MYWDAFYLNRWNKKLSKQSSQHRQQKLQRLIDSIIDATNHKSRLTQLATHKRSVLGLCIMPRKRTHLVISSDIFDTSTKAIT